MNSIIIQDEIKNKEINEIKELITNTYNNLSRVDMLKIKVLDINCLMNDFKLEKISYEDMINIVYNDGMNKPIEIDKLINICEEVGFQGIRENNIDNNYIREIICRKALNNFKNNKFMRNKNSNKFIINSDFTTYLSQGIITNNILKELDNLGLNIYGLPDINAENNITDLSNDLSYLINFNNNPNEKDILFRVDHIAAISEESNIDILKNNNFRKWGYFFHEYDSLPPSWVSELSKFDRVYFVSSFCAEAARKSGMTSGIHILPHGVDTSTFYPREGSKKLWTEEFVFLTVAKQSRRKGIIELLSAFQQTFHEQDNVRLVIKDLASNDYVTYADYIHHPNITLIKENWDSNQIAELMRNSDCFVLPSFVEGFGLPILEAKATKLPVITTNFGGQADFCNSKDTFLLNYNIEERKENTPPEIIAHWCIPDINNLSEIMLDVINNQQKRNEIAQKGYDKAIKMTWKNSLIPLINDLREIYG